MTTTAASHVLSTIGFAAATSLGATAGNSAAAYLAPSWASAGGLKQLGIEWAAPTAAAAVIAPLITGQPHSAFFAAGLSLVTIGAQKLLVAMVPAASQADAMGYALRYGAPILLAAAVGAIYHAI